ncbi:CopG family transcriptional regulator [Gemmatimonas sp.]|uniref:CopG family transcriptional regulator n=1 Tax=Gemmatimonas sp. TaxID=1962908 RepID=UPI0039832763
MGNVTVTLEEDVARWARIRAAQLDISVSRVRGDLLQEQRRRRVTYETEMRKFLAREHRAIDADGSAYPSRDPLHDRTDRR